MLTLVDSASSSALRVLGYLTKYLNLRSDTCKPNRHS